MKKDLSKYDVKYCYFCKTKTSHRVINKFGEKCSICMCCHNTIR